ncbi:TPA: 50S ribosomal protein L13 [Candidatus Saccharibacteria bacterium]|nr:50S ribosomal protein L13 [Candidatus Saccharibacteria bacterium]HRK40906.1 50S ribosomal protein L13 [Candidatus Saccharibacteria bacterium]
MKTYSKKASEVSHAWVLIDASEAPLGRVATKIATRLIGKYKPNYTPHMDDGDYVVVINADKLVLTGNKADSKVYYRHTGFPGGIKERSLKEVKQLDSTKAVVAAVKGMLPRNKQLADRLARLRVFPGETHEHTAQQPVKVEVK